MYRVRKPAGAIRNQSGSGWLPPGSAGYATLEVYDFNDGNYWITVSGQANLASVPPGNLYITLYADDTRFDDNIFDTKWLSTNPDGSFHVEFPLRCSRLDEDWGRADVREGGRAVATGSWLQTLLLEIQEGRLWAP